MMKKIVLTFGILSLGLLTGCMNGNAPRYGDVHRTFPIAPPDTQKTAQTSCDMTGQMTARYNESCVGKVLSAGANSGTITVLKPGLAVPVATIDAAPLAPPAR